MTSPRGLACSASLILWPPRRTRQTTTARRLFRAELGEPGEMIPVQYDVGEVGDPQVAHPVEGC